MIDNNLTGTEINYFFICKTKLWLYSKFQTMEHSSDVVKEGKIIHESVHQRMIKEVSLPGMKIDLIKKKNDLVIYEVKKSKKMEAASIYQLLFYLYKLKDMGITAKGILDYPIIKKTEEIELTEKKERELEEISGKIIEITNGPMPSPEMKSYCKKCSYYDFCWV
ncbi:MAG: CRISPR-associated protein Cas4 [Candidatus Methanofastidiosa archaeon]|jgi:CRISPR-associated exonuclease Cas4|nr:CRISPR-associated protein Cas4 [Candidatus Methanofastidiosa archaeon]